MLPVRLPFHEKHNDYLEESITNIFIATALSLTLSKIKNLTQIIWLYILR